MAFDTTADFIQTAGDVIDEALEILGVLSEGETSSLAQQTSGLRSLNQLIKLWSADTQIYTQQEYILDLNPAFPTVTGDYLLGVSNVGYIPNKVLNATLLNTTTSVEIPLSPLTQEEWYALTNKTTTSVPTQYYQKPNAVGGDLELKFWPVPIDQTYDVRLWLQLPLRDVTTVTSDVYFTQEWFLPLSFGLAFILAHKYGLDDIERTRLKTTAAEYKEMAETYYVDGSLFIQPGQNNG